MEIWLDETQKQHRQIGLIGQCFRMGIFQKYIYSGKKKIVPNLPGPVGWGRWRGTQLCLCKTRPGKSPSVTGRAGAGKVQPSPGELGLVCVNQFPCLQRVWGWWGRRALPQWSPPAADATSNPTDLAWISTLFALWGGIPQCLKMWPSRLFTI